LPQDLVEGRNGSAHGRHQRLLLGDIEGGRRAGGGSLVDEGKNATGGGQVLACSPQPVLRRNDLKLGATDADDCRKNNNVLIEAADNGGFLGRARYGGVFAPEINGIASI